MIVSTLSASKIIRKGKTKIWSLRIGQIKYYSGVTVVRIDSRFPELTDVESLA